MDALFEEVKEDDTAVGEMEEVSETTVLLRQRQHYQRRRSSIAIQV